MPEYQQDRAYEQLLNERRLFIKHYQMDRERSIRKLRLQRLQAVVFSLVALTLFLASSLYIAYEMKLGDPANDLLLLVLVIGTGLFAVVFSLLSLQMVRQRRDFRELDLLAELDKSWLLIDELQESLETLRRSQPFLPFTEPGLGGGETDDDSRKR